MSNETLSELVDAVHEAVISVVGEEFVVLGDIIEDCYMIRIIIPTDENS